MRRFVGPNEFRDGIAEQPCIATKESFVEIAIEGNLTAMGSPFNVVDHPHRLRDIIINRVRGELIGKSHAVEKSRINMRVWFWSI